MNTILLSMPFGALERQALGLSLLKPSLEKAGHPTTVRYFGFDFARLIGVSEYRWVNHELPYIAFAGDWCFTSHLYGDRASADREYVDQILTERWRISESDLNRLLKVRAQTGNFLDHCMGAINWNDYQMVGFTSTFEQNIASLALAKRLKQAFPHLKTVFGGANWEGEMGLELHRQFPFVDYVCSGEAELSLPALCNAIDAGQLPSSIPGLSYRHANTSITTPPGKPLENLDELPIPDYSDFFENLESTGVDTDVVPVLLFESARGCWWGAKSHCTFCGLNGGAMAFRAKSQTRALSELRSLVSRWRVSIVEAVDNILDMAYFDKFLPALTQQQDELQLFYEVKANLSRRHMKSLAAAGVHRIQPGIESMNDHVLALMRKGTTALQNIQMLKWCQEYGISAEWNLLYGFPGETRADYVQMLSLLPAIRHLRAPSACGPLRLDRFSPYFDHAETFGLTNLRAISSMRFLYPFEESVLSKISYYFDFDYPDGIAAADHAAVVIRYVDTWQRNPELGTLTASLVPDGSLLLVDSRSTATLTHLTLRGIEQAAFEYCDTAHSIDGVHRHLRQRFPDQMASIDSLRAFLDSAVANYLMVRDGDRYLSLAIASPDLRPTLERAEEQKPRSQFAVLES